MRDILLLLVFLFLPFLRAEEPGGREAAGGSAEDPSAKVYGMQMEEIRGEEREETALEGDSRLERENAEDTASASSSADFREELVQSPEDTKGANETGERVAAWFLVFMLLFCVFGVLYVHFRGSRENAIFKGNAIEEAKRKGGKILKKMRTKGKKDKERRVISRVGFETLSEGEMSEGSWEGGPDLESERAGSVPPTLMGRSHRLRGKEEENEFRVLSPGGGRGGRSPTLIGKEEKEGEGRYEVSTSDKEMEEMERGGSEAMPSIVGRGSQGKYSLL